MHQKNLLNKNFKLNIGGTDERDLEEAIKNSLKDMENTQNNLGEKPQPEEKDNKPNYFSGNAVSLESSGGILLLFF